MVPPRRVLAAAAAAAVAVAFLAAASQAPVVSDPLFGYAGGLAWEKASAGGLDRALAAGDGKPVVVYFWAVWCQFCKKLDTEVFPWLPVRTLLEERFHRVFVDLDEDRTTARRFGVLYPPALLFLNSTGSVLFRLNGYIDREDMLLVLQEVLAGATGSREGNQTHAEHGKPPSTQPRFDGGNASVEGGLKPPSLGPGNLSLPPAPAASP